MSRAYLALKVIDITAYDIHDIHTLSANKTSKYVTI